MSYPLQLRAQRRALEDFTPESQDDIRRTKDSKVSDSVNEDDSYSSVMILEDNEQLGEQIEQWAYDYTSKFVHAAGPKFYPTTIAHILGIAFVKKGLPEVRLSLQ